jgi:aspartate racemase
MEPKEIILGCTEISLIVDENDIKVPVFDTTRLHSKSAIEFILN